MSEPADIAPTLPPDAVVPPSKSPPPERSLAEKGRIVGTVLLFLVALAWLGQWISAPRYQGLTLDAWRTRLDDPDRLQRIFAVEAIASLAAHEASTCGELRERILEDADEEVRGVALAALTALLTGEGDGTETQTMRRRAMVEELLAVGREDLASERRVRSLGALLSLSGTIQNEMSELAQEYRPRVLAVMLERLEEGAEAERRAILVLLEPIAQLPTEAELPLLTITAKESGPYRERAVRCLTAIPNLSARSIDVLLEDLATATLVSRVLPHLKRWGAEAVPGLILALKPGDPRASLAREALRQIGPAALPALDDAWREKGSPARRMAAQALASLGPAGMALLLPGLGSPDEATALLARDAFLGAGPAAREFLLQQASANDPALATAVAELLKDLPDPATQKPT